MCPQTPIPFVLYFWNFAYFLSLMWRCAPSSRDMILNIWFSYFWHRKALLDLEFLLAQLVTPTPKASIRFCLFSSPWSEDVHLNLDFQLFRTLTFSPYLNLFFLTVFFAYHLVASICPVVIFYYCSIRSWKMMRFIFWHASNVRWPLTISLLFSFPIFSNMGTVIKTNLTSCYWK